MSALEAAGYGAMLMYDAAAGDDEGCLLMGGGGNSTARIPAVSITRQVSSAELQAGLLAPTPGPRGRRLLDAGFLGIAAPVWSRWQHARRAAPPPGLSRRDAAGRRQGSCSAARCALAGSPSR